MPQLVPFFFYFRHNKLKFNSNLDNNLIRSVILCKGFKSNVKHRKVFNKKKLSLNLGINLKSIDNLNKDILKNLYNRELIGENIFNLDPYSLFYTIFDTKNTVYLTEIFPDLEFIIGICADNYDEQTVVYLYNGIIIDNKNINDIILSHNKKIRPAHGNLALKRLIKANLNIITPGFTGNPFSTPLSTFHTIESKAFDPHSVTAKSLYND